MVAVMFAVPVFASDIKRPIDTQSSVYLVALNSPVASNLGFSCVEFAKAYLGRSGEVWGRADSIKPTVGKPYVGGLVLTKEGPLGHVAVIVNIVGNSLQVKEANYIKGKITTRELPVDSPVIRGYR